MRIGVVARGTHSLKSKGEVIGLRETCVLKVGSI